MSGALIGLIGVVAGALLGGAVSLYVQRNQERRLAAAAGRLIAGELGVVERRLRSSLVSQHWWDGELPNDAWQAHLKDLALNVSPAELEKVDAAYAIIDRWNKRRRTGAIDPKTLERLEFAWRRIWKAQYWLLHRRAAANRPFRIAGNVSLLIAGILGVVVLGCALFIPRVDVNATTVATALEF